MNNIIPVDISKCSFDIHKDLSVSPRERGSGPPIRIDGLTAGIVTMEHSVPHGGEVHPDGDEILYVISGKVKVTGDSAPDTPLELTAGESCIVKAGEWHKVDLITTIDKPCYTVSNHSIQSQCNYLINKGLFHGGLDSSHKCNSKKVSV